tara:strand:- start:5894 stop:6187 length:294 start_codon:yes stop_codon:yes gene_type:complete
MKITKTQLKQIIKEELKAVKEAFTDYGDDPRAAEYHAQELIDAMYQEQAGNVWHYIQTALQISPGEEQRLWDIIREDAQDDPGVALQEASSKNKEAL